MDSKKKLKQAKVKLAKSTANKFKSRGGRPTKVQVETPKKKKKREASYDDIDDILQEDGLDEETIDAVKDLIEED